ncbi:hypothetical protein H5410_005706 [Solanum commersonii]|uniref:Uncharacterized protein n=1 Tax=Solanum commersonii TaxID=4109 RepID=A0A9J6A7W2_SOLCO|nr:hypothetical protein H5410_005706 [Solanum commersonii]
MQPKGRKGNRLVPSLRRTNQVLMLVLEQEERMINKDFIPYAKRKMEGELVEGIPNLGLMPQRAQPEEEKSLGNSIEIRGER